jgi:hypothetical protein
MLVVKFTLSPLCRGIDIIRLNQDGVGDLCVAKQCRGEQSRGFIRSQAKTNDRSCVALLVLDYSARSQVGKRCVPAVCVDVLMR